ncbi:ribose-5-phosphate isomerase [Iris pallida]|uniref:Ribose-5-phosphate isomerase n=1 Tax=Iris pallida TaxID=29817 RepID=A0AAX6GHD3_IRIPA|nr:ribose-5-phosphate isomerase [Iris pallida]
MKKQYCAIAEMLGPNASGFGWNDELKCVMCDKDIFQDWVKSHPNTKGLRNKPFLYYDDLGAIFGKNRTRGEAAEGSADAVDAMEEEATNEVQVHDLDDIYENVNVHLLEMFLGVVGGRGKGLRQLKVLLLKVLSM